MGMPVITPGTGTRNQAITDLIQSVALQETALSHMLNAEGEKMQAIIAMPDATLEDLMEMNESVKKLINAVTRLEMMFVSKLELFADQFVPDAPSELAKISVPSVTINVPLNDPTAQQAAVAQAIAAAQTQLDPGFTVSFTPTSYSPGALTGTFTVTNNTNPADTATDAAARPITVLSTVTNAAMELTKISVPSVVINVPLNDPTAQQAAVTQAVAAAQAQVNPAYTVSFTPTGYNPSGILTGAFTVTNNTNPADTATGTGQTIAVSSTVTDAAQQLANINVTSVTIPVPLTDPTAEQLAINQAIIAAQAQVVPGYTVSFSPTGYNSTTGTLTGVFTVTNTTNPADTATNSTDQTIAVNYTPSTATATSNAAAQFISGTLLTGDLSGISGIGGVSAQYINGVTPGTTVVNTASLDTAALGATPVVINSVTLPLSNFLTLGLVNQYAQASIDGASRAFDGAVSNSGVVSLDGSGGFPANATLNLMSVLPATPVLTQADLTLGAIIGAAQWSASVGNTLATTTDVTNPVQGRTYNIAGATLDLDSPIVSDLVNLFDTIANTASVAVSNLGSDIINGLLSGVNGVMSILDGLVPGVSILSNTLSVNVSLVDLATELAPILQTPITSGDGVLTVNFSAGTVTIDLNQLLGINNLPPNTSLLSSTVINSIVADLNEVLQSLQTLVQNLIMSKLTGTAAVTISGGIDLLDVLGIPTAGLDISYSGSLADLVTNTQPLVITGTGTLAPFSAALGPLVSTIQTTLGNVLNPLINDPTTGILPTAINAVAADVTAVSNQLSPVFSLISSVISIIINVQLDNADGANTFTEIPVQLNLLSDATVLNLGKVVVGPNTYTP